MRALIEIIFYGLAITVLSIGCRAKVKQATVDFIKIDLDQPKASSVREICSDIEIVPLETSDSCLLGIVYPMVYNAQYYMRQNNPNVVTCFDSLGHFRYRIDNEGRGQNEYASIINIRGDPYASKLYLPESLDNINIYDGQGNFQQKIRLDSVREVIHDVVPLNRDTLIIVSGRYNLTFSFYSQRENRVVAQKKDHLPACAYSPFFRIEDKVYYFPSLDQMIYEVRDTSFVPAWGVDFGKYNNNLATYADFNREITRDEEFESFINRFNHIVSYVWGSPEYICLGIVLKSGNDWKPIFVVLNRKTQKYAMFEGENSFKERFTFSYFNNLIGNQWIWTIGASQLEEDLDETLLDDKNKAIYRKVRLEDNPVVVKMRLKV